MAAAQQPESDYSRAASDRKLERGVAATLVFAAIILVAVSYAKSFRKPHGDFPNHVESGRRLLTGEPLYADDWNLPYPPFWAMAFAPLSTIPVIHAQVLVFPVGVLALATLILLLNRLANPMGQLDTSTLFWIWAAVLLVSSRFVFRDLDECGPNLILTALVWFAIALWVRNRDTVAGIPLGLAIALKCTAALMLAYFLYKRQWRVAAATTLTTIAFTVAPLALQGPQHYTRDIQTWLQTLSRGLTAPSPILGLLGEEPVINKSLRSTLGRYLMQIPDGHTGRIDHPAFLDILHLSPSVASTVVTVVTVALVLSLAWICRRPIRARDEPAVLWECAIVSLAALLLSPITWSQHCVATIPALYLLIRRCTLDQTVPNWIWGTSFLYVALVLIFNRSMFGHNLGYALDSYRPTTWAILLLLVVTCTLRPRPGFRIQTASTTSPQQQQIHCRAREKVAAA